jgi:D-arabinitol dehydrogenase (NADP+)
MKAVVYSAPRDFDVVEVPTPEPCAGEVRVRIELAGVCGTDLQIHDGTSSATFPLTPGHEMVGIVESMGPNVTGLALGKRVVVNGSAACGACAFCSEGRPLQCTALSALGVTGPGGFAESVLTPASRCVNVGDLDPEIAVFAEPAACATHGMEVLQPRPGSTALVLGSGPNGLLLAQLLMHDGAARVTVAAPTHFKLEIARQLGIDEVIQIPREPADAFALLHEVRPEGFDNVVVATAVPGVFEIATPLTRDGGTVLWYGITTPDDRVAMSPYDVYRREIAIKGSFGQVTSFRQAVLALQRGRIFTEGLITHIFALDDYGRALGAVRRDRSCLKAVIDPRLRAARVKASSGRLS